ncbi:MAG: histidine kinase, partial [Phaeodactylibacter sp.]|nr:histidine kinase [Phaeodactylibacter sp.]
LWVSNEEEGELGRVRLDHPEQGLYEKFSMWDRVKAGAIPIDKGVVRDALAMTKLTVDAGNNLWGISPEGVVKLKPDLSGLEIYNELDGLLWLDEELKVITANQLERLSSGELIVGFRKGISIFDPQQLQGSRERPRPYLTSFKVYNNEWKADSSLFYTKRIPLGHKENYFSFEFSAVGYTHPEKYQYQYKLEGVDEDWILAGQRNYAAYTNVPGGDYIFLVKVANSDGIWNEEPAKVRLSVATPWWRQLWFRGGLLLLFFAGAYAFYRYRLGQVQKAERLKSEFEKKVANLELTALRAQMNPHFLFNCLNSIDHYIIKNETRKASEYLNSFSRLIRLILQNSRSNYVNLKDELETLTLYMEMESLRFSHRFDYEVQVQPGLPLNEIEIPPMLIQPYVENAIWHGLMLKTGKGTVRLGVSKENGILKCTIQDDGIGRQKAGELKRPSRSGKKSMGMSITKDRIETINKIYETNTTVKIIDLVDDNGKAAGTKVELMIPV